MMRIARGGGFLDTRTASDVPRSCRGTSLARNRSVKPTLFAVLLAACATSPAEGIPGDHSPDDGTPPDESTGGKADGANGPIIAGKGVLIDAPTIVHVYWG